MARLTSDHPLVIGRVVGDVVDPFVPSVNMCVMYKDSSNQVYNGHEWLPSSVTSKPRVDVHGGDLRSFFTLIMTDPDTPGPSDPYLREHLHYGQALNVYIPGKRNIQGKRFGFCRFSGVFDIQDLKSINDASATHNLLLDKGFKDFSIKYVGGMFILIKLGDSIALENALGNKDLSSHFKSMSCWNPTTRPSNRLVWLRISWLPSQLWWEDSFSSIARHYGDVLILEECCTRQFNLTFGKVCVLSDRMDLINDTLQIPFNKEMISVRVAEFEGDTDTIFNVYTLASSSDEDDTDSESSEDSPANGYDDSDVRDEFSGKFIGADEDIDKEEGFPKNFLVGDNFGHANTHAHADNSPLEMGYLPMTYRKKKRFASVKLIDSMNGINNQNLVRKGGKKSSKPPTNPSPSNSQCNNTGFTAALAVLVTEASQSRQHVDTSLIKLESRKSPTTELFDVHSGRISIVIVNTKEYHYDVLAITTRIMRRTL
ncbi:cytochrome P450 [Tanacetum coccineum]